MRPAEAARRTRIVVVDDHPLVMEGVARLLENELDVEIVACCADGESALDALIELRPDLVILDLRMPRMGGVELLRRAADVALSINAIILTAEITDDDLLEAVGLGVKGIVLKDCAPDALVACVRSVRAGKRWLESQITGRALDRLLAREAARQRVVKALTQREIELVRLVSRGLRNKEVATALGITEGTAKIHLHRIYEKLGVSTRVALVNYAYRELT